MQQPEPGKETRALLSALNNQCAHVLGILEGLPSEALRRPVLPSGWTCLGLVRHLALDVERFWFRAVVAGERVDLEKGDAAWQVPLDMPAEAVFGLYRQETELANVIVAATPLDAEPAWWPEEIFPDLPPRGLRDTILHVITETACHAGHLDVVRELIDGRTWQVLTSRDQLPERTLDLQEAHESRGRGEVSFHQLAERFPAGEDLAPAQDGREG